VPTNHRPKSPGCALIWALIVLATQTFGQNLATNTSFVSTQPLALDPAIQAWAASVPADMLQVIQKQANSPPWNDPPVRTQRILQRCASLQQLLTTGASDATLSNALAASRLRISLVMAFGEHLFRNNDSHHSEMFYASVLQDHTNRATVVELNHCHLWLGRFHQERALQLQHEQDRPDLANPEFEAAAWHYLKATTISQDWGRELGWLKAAECCRELGQVGREQDCLMALLNEPAASLRSRDLATYLLANSYYAQKRYADAAKVYQQLNTFLAPQSDGQPEEYPGQKAYLGLAATGLNWCAARQAEQAGPSKPNSGAAR